MIAESEFGEQRFRELVENSLTGISIIHNGQFVYLNSEQQRIFGPENKLQNIRDLQVHKSDLRKFEQVCDAIDEQKPLKTDVEIKFYPSSESEQRQELRYVIVRTDVIHFHGQSMTMVNMVDITHSKRMEHLALLKSKMVSLGHISVGIAHEIRSPLSGIDLLIQGVKESIGKPDNREEVETLLEQIEKATAKIEAVVKRVLDYTKPAEPQVKPGNINQAILSALNLSRTAVRKENIELVTSLKEDLAPVYFDFHLMEQVFLNLINNAVAELQGIDKERIIEISSSQQGNDILIAISDSGTGIPEKLRDKIFDPFFSTKSAGTGIGLSICQRIVIDHGGMINISTSPFQGAQFNIRLPIEKRLFKR